MADNPVPENTPAETTDASRDVKAEHRTPEAGDVELIYKIEGKPKEVPIFELANMLDALGNIVEEADRVINRDKHKLVVKVKPFQEGSWIMDLTMSMQNHPEVLFFLTNPDAIKRIQTVLEYIGLIKKGKEAIATVMDVIRFLKDGKPDRIEPAGEDKFNIVKNGQQLQVNGTVNNLSNNITIQNFFYPAIGAPMQRDGVDGVVTFLKDAPQESRVFVPKQELLAIKAYSEPEPAAPRVEVVENTTTEFLNPKAGTYGDTEGTWTFTRAGTNVRIPARITDEKFLAKFQRGSVRFFHNDLLKVKLKQEQTLKGGKVKTKYEIIEVLDYTKAPIKRTRNGSKS